MAIYDYIYDCVFSRLGQVFQYMTGAHRNYCGPVITDTESYGTLKYFSSISLVGTLLANLVNVADDVFLSTNKDDPVTKKGGR